MFGEIRRDRGVAAFDFSHLHRPSALLAMQTVWECGRQGNWVVPRALGEWVLGNARETYDRMGVTECQYSFGGKGRISSPQVLERKCCTPSDRRMHLSNFDGSEIDESPVAQVPLDVGQRTVADSIVAVDFGCRKSARLVRTVQEYTRTVHTIEVGYIDSVECIPETMTFASWLARPSRSTFRYYD